MPHTVPQSIIDAIQGISDAESENLLSRLNEPLPALNRASDHIRSLLLSLEADRQTRMEKLVQLLHSLHAPGTPRTRHVPDPFLALLSTRFLLLKVAEAQALLCRRYENSLPQLRDKPEIHDQVVALLDQARAGLSRLESELQAMGLETPPLL